MKISSYIAIIDQIDGELYVQDLELAKRLGYSRPRDIGYIIRHNTPEIEAFGSLRSASANPSTQGGRPGTAYWLNEKQALLVCALSRTPKAAQVRKALIDAFVEYRRLTSTETRPARQRKLRAPITRRAPFDLSVKSTDMMTADIHLRIPFKLMPAALEKLLGVFG